jgi:hypothetical protein
MKNPRPKDIFIIHGKRSRPERALTEFLTRFLGGAGYTIYDYGDWDWERIERSVGHSWEHGDEIGVESFTANQPPLRTVSNRNVINDEPLRKMLSTARLVVVVLPLGRASPGVLHELQLLFGLRAKRYVSKERVQRVLKAHTSPEQHRFFELLDSPSTHQHILVCFWDRGEGKIGGSASNFIPLQPFDGDLSSDQLAAARVLEVAVAASALLLRTYLERSSADEEGRRAEIERAFETLRRACAATIKVRAQRQSG